MARESRPLRERTLAAPLEGPDTDRSFDPGALSLEVDAAPPGAIILSAAEHESFISSSEAMLKHSAVFPASRLVLSDAGVS